MKNAISALYAHYFRRLRLPLGILLLVLAAAEALLVCTCSGRLTGAYRSYETILSNALAAPCFTAAALIGLICVLTVIRSDYGGRSHAMYSLMTLPVPRAALPLTWATVTLTFLLALCAVQLVLLCALYPAYTALSADAVQHLSQFYAGNPNAFPAAALPAAGYTRGLYRTLLNAPLAQYLIPCTPLRALLLLVRLALPTALITWLGANTRRDLIPVLAFAYLVIYALLHRFQRIATLHSWEWLIVAALLLLFSHTLLRGAVRRVQRAENLP